MGTTLGLTGAYNLAGSLLHHSRDPVAAFAEYEEKMRPVVDKAQKLAPGNPHILYPETAWGIWAMRTILGIITWSGVANLMFMVLGPRANAVPVEDYGFKQFQDSGKPQCDESIATILES